MNLVQKLPIGLGIACMMLSSCSKEDVQTPAPMAESVNTSSNAKVDATLAPAFSSTKWSAGIGILPTGWDRNVVGGYSSNQNAYPTGVSNQKNLWGDPETPFVNGLSLIPWAPKITSFITVTTTGTTSNSMKSSVKTKIRNLTPGKKYALTVYISSTLSKAGWGYGSPNYAKSCLLKLGSQNINVDISSFKYCWVEKIVTFTASSTQMDFAFSASPALPGQYAIAHLLVTDNAVKAIN